MWMLRWCLYLFIGAYRGVYEPVTKKVLSEISWSLPINLRNFRVIKAFEFRVEFSWKWYNDPKLRNTFNYVFMEKSRNWFRNFQWFVIAYLRHCTHLHTDRDVICGLVPPGNRVLLTFLSIRLCGPCRMFFESGRNWVFFVFFLDRRN